MLAAVYVAPCAGCGGKSGARPFLLRQVGFPDIPVCVGDLASAGPGPHSHFAESNPTCIHTVVLHPPRHLFNLGGAVEGHQRGALCLAEAFALSPAPIWHWQNCSFFETEKKEQHKTSEPQLVIVVALEELLVPRDITKGRVPELCV